MLKPELTGAKGPVLVHPDKELCRHSRQPRIRADQLQPWRGDWWKTVELEGEEDGLRPRPLHAILGVPSGRERGLG